MPGRPSQSYHCAGERPGQSSSSPKEKPPKRKRITGLTLLKHFRKEIRGLGKSQHRKIEECRSLLKRLKTEQQTCNCSHPSIGNVETSGFNMKPIGFIKTWYKTKNGTPRQPSVCAASTGTLAVSWEEAKDANPAYALEGLSSFSHVWLLFVFHANDPASRTSARTKVAPPRLRGRRVGCLATRSPHRPNAIGLSLVRLQRIEGRTLHLAELDLLDGTPVIDVKPYIPAYDCPGARDLAEVERDVGPEAELEEPIEGQDITSCGNGQPIGGQDVRSRDNGQPIRGGDRNRAEEVEAENESNDRDVDSNSDCPPHIGAEPRPTASQSARCAAPPQPISGSESSTVSVPAWVTRAPALSVSFTARARAQIERMYAPASADAATADQNAASRQLSQPEPILPDTFRQNTATQRVDQSATSGDASSAIENATGRHLDQSVALSGDASTDTLPSANQITASHMYDQSAPPPSEALSSSNQNTALNPLNHSVTASADSPSESLSSANPSAAGRQPNQSATSSQTAATARRLSTAPQLEAAIRAIVSADPRSVYRRDKCSDRLYFLTVDAAHVTVWFDDEEGVAEVVRVKPVEN